MSTARISPTLGKQTVDSLEPFAAELIVRWVSDLFFGQIIPPTLFPEILSRIVFALPFALIYSAPLLIYVGMISPSQWAASMVM